MIIDRQAYEDLKQAHKLAEVDRMDARPGVSLPSGLWTCTCGKQGYWSFGYMPTQKQIEDLIKSRVTDHMRRIARKQGIIRTGS